MDFTLTQMLLHRCQRNDHEGPGCIWVPHVRKTCAIEEAVDERFAQFVMRFRAAAARPQPFVPAVLESAR
eukprot:1502884-Alexandrium_andersonii.AAC.1